MAADISTKLRKLVAERANYCCEYCLMPQFAVFHKHEPDHIVPRQHGGQTDEENLALACMRCNRYKGPNVGSFDPNTGKLEPFFNPRTQDWTEHFTLSEATIEPLTAEGRVTVKILRINDEERLQERESLISSGVFPF
ncbi:MAG: HNH endonuclease signature motif containing protein [Chloroflexota bacterium]